MKIPRLCLLSVFCIAPLLNAQDDDDVFILPPFEVSVEREFGYRAGTSVSGTRAREEVKNLPFSLQVITDNLIADLKISDLEDAIRFAPGVQDNRDNLGNFGKFNVRGIQQTYSLRNGFRRYAPNDTSTAAQVEVVKGPAGLLYGQVFPGGVVNVVTKKPQHFNHYQVELRYGSYGSHRAEADFGGPILKEGRLSYRIITAYEDYESFVEYSGRRVKLFSPSISFSPAPWLRVTLDYERYIRNERAPHAGMIAVNLDDLNQAIANPENPFGINNGPFNPDVIRSRSFTGVADYLPRNFNTNGPDAFSDYDIHGYSAYVDMRVNSWLNIRSAGMYSDSGNNYYANFVNNSLRSGVDLVSRASWRDSRNQVTQLLTDAFMEFDTGPVSHRLLVGVEYYKDKFRAANHNELPPSGTANYVRLPNSYDITRDWALEFRFINPIGDFERSPRPDLLPENRPDTTRQSSSGTAFYFTEQAALFEERLRLIAGIRYEEFDASNELTATKGNEDAITTQFGALYSIIPSVAVFGSYSESFYRNGFYNSFAVDPSLIGQLAPPQEGVGMDVGFKIETPDRRFAGTISIFDLKQRNILVEGLIDGQRTQILAGERTSRGVELDFHFAPITGWQLLLNYAFTQSKDTESGMRMPNVPRHQASFWTRYEVTDGAMEGFFIGGGVLYMGKRPAGNDTNIFSQAWNFTADSYVTVDAFIGKKFSFQRMDVTISLNVSNLTDAKYIRGGQTLPAEPRRYVLAVTTQF
jgi:iron complex outermembrane recepter protein